MTEIHNNKTLYKRRKDLRKVQTLHEGLLWKHLKTKKFSNFKFKRQHSIGFYIVDFYCAKAKLVIEIDGDSHFTSNGMEYDKVRSIFLRQLNMNILRFTNEEIFTNIDSVLNNISKALPPLAPPYKGGGSSASKK